MEFVHANPSNSITFGGLGRLIMGDIAFHNCKERRLIRYFFLSI